MTDETDIIGEPAGNDFPTADEVARQIFSDVDEGEGEEEGEGTDPESEVEPVTATDPESEPSADPEPEPEVDAFGLPVEPKPEPEVKPKEEEKSALQLEFEKVQGQNERLLKLLEDKQTQAVETPKAEEPQQETEQEVYSKLATRANTIAQKYSFNIQPEMIENIQSEDPEKVKEALNSLILGTAIAVHRTVEDEFDAKLKAFQGTAKQEVEQKSREQMQKEAANVFYTKYPQLNSPEIRSVVGQVGQEFAQKGVQWNDETMLLIAQETRNRLERSGLTLLKPIGGKVRQPFQGGGKGVKNSQESEVKDDPNSPEAIKQFATR